MATNEERLCEKLARLFNLKLGEGFVFKWNHIWFSLETGIWPSLRLISGPRKTQFNWNTTVSPHPQNLQNADGYNWGEVVWESCKALQSRRLFLFLLLWPPSLPRGYCNRFLFCSQVEMKTWKTPVKLKILCSQTMPFRLAEEGDLTASGVAYAVITMPVFDLLIVQSLKIMRTQESALIGYFLTAFGNTYEEFNSKCIYLFVCPSVCLSSPIKHSLFQMSDVKYCWN